MSSTKRPSLRKIRHPVVLTPGLGTRGEYGGGSPRVVPDLPTAVKPESNEGRIADINKQHPETAPYSSSGATSECRSQNSQRSQRHSTYISGSLCDSPSTHHGGSIRGDGNAHPSRHSTHFTREAGFAENNQLSSQAQSDRPSNKISVDGVDFEVVSPLPPTSIPAPAPAHTASGDRGRSQAPTVSAHPRTRSPSPAYGAWQSDHPRQRRPSFLERAQTRLQNSLHEHLVKAGRRPLPSFTVRKVTKAQSGDVGTRYEAKRPADPAPPLPPITREEWVARVDKLMRSKQEQAEKRESIGVASAKKEKREKDNWRDLGRNNEDDVAPFQAQERPWASEIPLPMRVRNSAPAPPTPGRKRGIADLRIITDAPNFSRPTVLEALTPESYEYISSSDELRTPLDGPREASDEWSQYGRSVSKKASDDSLFLGRESSLRSPADYSFFSSEYAQKRAAKDHTEGDEESRQQHHKECPSAQLSVGPSLGNRDVEAEPRKPESSLPLTREQLSLAALPSALEDLWQPFLFDDRRGLPSRGKPQELAAERAPSQRKGVDLTQVVSQ
ncbi:hypothetical protein F5Y14DRAFT_213244 [Nemania sp. NC0429]|nr:hypothetical protein F5Y14DRAFT_213244 [Nemania sp. NC0429]